MQSEVRAHEPEINNTPLSISATFLKKQSANEAFNLHDNHTDLGTETKCKAYLRSCQWPISSIRTLTIQIKNVTATSRPRILSTEIIASPSVTAYKTPILRMGPRFSL